MFTAEFREQVHQRILDLVRADPRVRAEALTGSMALEAGDNWSDIDVAFGIAEGNPLEAVLDDWTAMFHQEWDVLAHFDLPSGPSLYRVFLLHNGLEVDVAVSPATVFGARGPNFRPLFGTPQQLEPVEQPTASFLIGLCWHHVLHTRSCIERHKPWQAEYWISETRHHLLELAYLRLGENAFHGRGFDRLPATLTDPLADALVLSLAEPELRRALAIVTRCLIAELEEWDAPLCTRLSPVIHEFGTS